MHLKRHMMNRGWPLPRKGNKYIVVPRFSKIGLPLLIILRDMLKVGRTRREIRQILNDKKIILNGKIITDEKLPAFPLDHLKIGNKNYKISFKNKKLNIEEAGEFKVKIRKVVGKKILKKGKTQINLLFGDNILIDKKININDSVTLNEKGKIVGILELKKGSKILVLFGKHIGKQGIIESVEEEKVTFKEGENSINLTKGDIIVLE